MQGVMGAFKIEKSFWQVHNRPTTIMADQWCMNRISGILNTRIGIQKRNEWDNTFYINQIDEVHKAWTNITTTITQGGIPAIRIVLE